MPNAFETVAPAPRKIMTLFYLVDSSGSMSGDKIGQVNAAMEEAITYDLKNLDSSNDDAEIKVAILEFNSGCRWITPATEPAPLGKVTWKPLRANGLTDMGAACKELESKLSRNAFLATTTGAYAPVLLMLSDGGPTDNFDGGMDVLRKNNWYQNAIKIAIAIGSGADVDVLARFTGNPESVITVQDKDLLYRLIKLVSVRASAFQSHSKEASSTVSTPEQDAAAIVNEVKKDLQAPTSSDDDWGEW